MSPPPLDTRLYADDLCTSIISLSSAGLLVQCDDYCRKHSITFNVSKSISIFFKSDVNKKCDITNLFVSGKAIEFVQGTKYLGFNLNSQLQTSMDVSRHSMHNPICYCETLDIVQSMSNVCCLGHIAQTCKVVLYNSNLHLVVSRNLMLVITVC